MKILPPDTLIAIAVERGLEMIIGILGILKAGAAYVPIDPNYPSEQITIFFKIPIPSLFLHKVIY